MKICVCVKHVPDTAAVIKIAGGNGFEESDVKFFANPYDEYAVEEAVSIVEEQGGEVVIITLGKPDAASTIRNAMAMGADRAILVKTDAQFLDSRTSALALKSAMEADGLPDMVFTGRNSIDSEGFQTQYRLAHLLGMPVVNEVSALSMDGTTLKAERETGGGEKQVLQLSMPCVIGATKGLNEPRYPKFKAIMMAKKKEIKEMDLDGLDVDTAAPATVIECLEVVPERSGAKMLDGSLDNQVTELVKILKEEEKVL